MTEVTLSLTQTLRTWTQTQTHTVRTDTHLKGSFPFWTNGQCVTFVNWVVSCWSRRRTIRLMVSVDKVNPSSARYSRRGLLTRFLPHFMSSRWLRRSSVPGLVHLQLKQHVNIGVKSRLHFDSNMRSVGFIPNFISVFHLPHFSVQLLATYGNKVIQKRCQLVHFH